MAQIPHFPEPASAPQMRFELEEAEALCRESLEQDPENPEVWQALGILLLIQGRFEEAIPCFQRVLETEPNHVEASKSLGDALLNVGRAVEAEKHFREALKIDPTHAQVQAGLGCALLMQKRFEESEHACDKAIELDPKLPEAYFYLANLRREQRSWEPAEQHYREAIRLWPEFAEAHINLGLTLQSQQRWDEALACFTEAIQIDPHNADAHFNEGYLRLARGDFQEGWKKYEWRLQKRDHAKRDFKSIPWDGQPLNGKRILIYADQGFGDTILFARFLPWVKQLGGTVLLECQASLTTLLSSCHGVDEVYASGATLGEFDCYAPIASLPALLEAGAEIPASVPYLSVPKESAEKWAKTFESHPQLRIGFCWKTNPNTYGSEHRSTSLSHFVELAKNLELRLISLQKGLAELELNGVSNEQVISLSEHLTTFADTSAAIEQMDLIITVDTAVAHLAGALGKPTWLLVNQEADWKWFSDREDSPFYPTMRIFRQKELGQWSPVFQQVEAELRKLYRGARERNVHGNQNELAIQLYGEGQIDAAFQLLREQSTIEPFNIVPLSNLGVLLVRHGKLEEGIEFCERSLKQNPRSAETRLALGLAYYKLGRWEDAAREYRSALKAAPNFAMAHNNLGNALRSIGDYQSAYVHFDEALRIQRDYPEAAYNRGCLDLLLGRWDTGWTGYAQRMRTKQFPQRQFDQPEWQGESLQGKRILVYPEQGFGDCIQFIRHAEDLKLRGAEVIVECDPALKRLHQGIAGIDEVVLKGSTLPAFDFRVSVASLPQILETTPFEPVNRKPYIQIQQSWLRSWKSELISGQKFKIGICWSGNPEQLQNRHRSIPLKAFEPLMEIPGVQLYSLQKGAGQGDLTEYSEKIIDLGNACEDFADTAAAMMHLDLILTIDTSVAHLAGALGRPTWVMLHTCPDWRWSAQGEKCEWYINMRLFRQKQYGDWDSVMSQVCAQNEISSRIR